MRVLTPAPDIVLRTVECADDLKQLAWWTAQRRDRQLGLDCETNAVDVADARFRLRTVQFADAHESWIVDVSTVRLDHLASVVFEHPRWRAHYSEADMRFLHFGLPGALRPCSELRPHISDTQVTLAWYDPRTVTSQDDAYGAIPLPRGLKPTVEREIPGQLLTAAEDDMHAGFREIAPAGMRRWEDEVKPHGFAHIPFADPRYIRYAGLDPLYTVRFAEKAEAEIRRRGQWAGYQEDLDFQWQIDHMTLRGLKIDEDYARWLDAELKRVVDERAPHLAHYGIKPSGMGAVVGTALESLGAVSPKCSPKTGKPSWDKDVLPVVAKEQDAAGALARDVVTVRRSGKFRAAYVKPMIECLPRDGRIRPSMRAVGTITTRQSASRPPTQQLPKEDTRVRAAVACDEGWVYVACDLSQGEPRTMAALSGDKNLLADIRSGDLNSAVASAAFGPAYDPAFGQDVTTPHYGMRKGAKAGFLAWCYGAGDAKVATTLGVEGPTARWRSRYSALSAYRDQQNAKRFVVLDNGWVAPLWDRAWIDEHGVIRDKGKPSRKGLNYSTQGNQRQILARSVRLLCARGWSWALAMLVHDEILLCVPEWMAPAAKVALEAAMTTTYRGVPIECEAKILGRTWAPRPAEFDVRELDAVEL